jgi:hypothetical protein
LTKKAKRWNVAFLIDKDREERMKNITFHNIVWFNSWMRLSAQITDNSFWNSHRWKRLQNKRWVLRWKFRQKQIAVWKTLDSNGTVVKAQTLANNGWFINNWNTFLAILERCFV